MKLVRYRFRDRILVKDGILLISGIMHHSISYYPDDYWRFTPSGFNYLLRKFPVRIIGVQGAPEFPHTLLGIGLKSASIKEIRPKFEELKSRFECELQRAKPAFQGNLLKYIYRSFKLDRHYPGLRRTLMKNKMRITLYG
jgi:hypothetical protein